MESSNNEINVFKRSKIIKLIQENGEKLHNISQDKRSEINSGGQRIIAELTRLQWIAPNPQSQRWPWINSKGQKTNIDRTMKERFLRKGGKQRWGEMVQDGRYCKNAL